MKQGKGLIFLLVLVAIAAGCSGASTAGGGAGNSGTDGTTTRQAAIIADHTVVPLFAHIPAAAISQAVANLHIFYGHTSHGSQLVTGGQLLDDRVDWDALDLEEDDGADLGHSGDAAWAEETRNRLSVAGNHDNVVIWAWCGGVQDNTEEGITAYLSAMDQLERDFPNVTFVYMTGHLFNAEWDGDKATLTARNDQIRTYCRDHNKVLYDFADIEGYDLGGTLHADATDACEWCPSWCPGVSCPAYSTNHLACDDTAVDGGCAHSRCLNCYIKGEAFWWLLARIAGWGGSY